MLLVVFGCTTCQEMLKENHSVHKLQKHLCMCHSDTCRQNEHSLSHYQAFVETSCQVETHRSLLQMLQTISLNSQSEGNGMSASISIRRKRKYLRGKHSNWIFDYKPTLPQGVGPLGSVSVYNLLSVLPAERFNYLTNMAELRTRYLDVSIAQPSVCIATIHHWWGENNNIGASLIRIRVCERERNSPRHTLTTPVLTNTINMLLLWVIELASL